MCQDFPPQKEKRMKIVHIYRITETVDTSKIDHFETHMCNSDTARFAHYFVKTRLHLDNVKYSVHGFHSQYLSLPNTSHPFPTFWVQLVLSWSLLLKVQRLLLHVPVLLSPRFIPLRKVPQAFIWIHLVCSYIIFKPI